MTIDLASVLHWLPATVSVDAYHVYRGTPAGIAAGDAGSCQDVRDANLLDTQFAEPLIPPLGQMFTFLIGFERNGADSGLGVAKDGAARRPATLCP